MTITHIEDLTPDPNNARRHNPRNIGVIERSLSEVGAARSIVIDEDGVILAGNATTTAAQQAGITRVRVVDADGDELIAVRRTGLTDEQKVKLALADNRAAELADWDPATLAALAADVDVSGLFYPHELAAAAQPDAGGVDPAELWKGMPEFENEAQAARTLHVHFPTADDCAAFCKLLGLSITENTKTVWYPSAPERGAYTFVADES